MMPAHEIDTVLHMFCEGGWHIDDLQKLKPESVQKMVYLLNDEDWRQNRAWFQVPPDVEEAIRRYAEAMPWTNTQLAD